MESKLFLWIIFTTCFFWSSFCSDNYGNWHRTLAPFQAHACDNDELLLRCTPNTIISVHYVFYGRTQESGHLCPGKRSAYYPTSNCHHPKALQVIHEKCHKSMMCRLHISPELFKDDPCPAVGKFVEVVYKCRPEIFLNKIVCEGNQLHLKCPPAQGLTIYSATFGTTQSGVDECPQVDGITPEDCLMDLADDTVRNLCSGKQNCSLEADDRTFGNPTCIGTKYLKVAYNCVEKELLLPVKKTPDDSFIQTTSFPAWARGIDHSLPTKFQAHTDRPSEITRQEMQSDEIPTDDTVSINKKQKIVGFMSKWMSAHKYIAGNKEKLILYLCLSLTIGFIVFGTYLGGRCVVRRLASRRSSKNDIALSNDAEDQFYSDSDLEQSFDPDILPPPPLLNYTASMKRQDSVVTPRTPINDDVELNHYFS